MTFYLFEFDEFEIDLLWLYFNQRENQCTTWKKETDFKIGFYSRFYQIRFHLDLMPTYEDATK